MRLLVNILRAFVVAEVASLLFAGGVFAESFLPPGNPVARHDLLQLERAGVIDVPVTSWPLPLQDLNEAISRVKPSELASADRAAYERLVVMAGVSERRRPAGLRWGASVSRHPQEVRAFQAFPREGTELWLGSDWSQGRFDFSLTASIAPDTDDVWRFDGSYVAVELGGWLLSAGFQERWWGPGNSGSLLLSSNARPVPSLSIQRASSEFTDSRWLRWLGPWTVSAFMGQLDSERAVPDPLLFGIRFTFRPVRGLEIGVSRTAQWCGDNRPCDVGTFVDLLLGKDNRGVNVNPENEPGNQLGGFDVRWSLPGRPLAVYAQWIAEDTRQGGPELGSWLRQVGFEWSGTFLGHSHHSFLEVSDTACHDGGLGFSEAEADCAYSHATYTNGYRYRGRPMGHGADADSLVYSIGTTLVQSDGHSWTAAVRRMTINRIGQPDDQHSLAAFPQDRFDIQLAYRRLHSSGSVEVGIGYRRIDGFQPSENENQMTGFIKWSVH